MSRLLSGKAAPIRDQSLIDNIEAAASVQTRPGSVIDRFMYSMLLGGSPGNLPFSISLTELRLRTTVFSSNDIS
jgi:hypothetical protein